MDYRTRFGDLAEPATLTPAPCQPLAVAAFMLWRCARMARTARAGGDWPTYLQALDRLDSITRHGPPSLRRCAATTRASLCGFTATTAGTGAARDVPPGTCWAFHHHRPLSAVPPGPAPDDLPPTAA